MNIYQQLINNGNKTAGVRILVNKDDYVLCSYGRSSCNKWIGQNELEYSLKGNINELNNITFVDKILDCLNVAINHEKLNISIIDNKKALSLKAFRKAKANQFLDFKYLSVNVDFREENKLIIYSFHRNKNKEWGANDDDALYLDVDSSKEEILAAINKQLANYKVDRVYR